MIDARANRVYFSFYEMNTHKKLVNDTIVDINDLIKLLNKHFSNKSISFVFVGDGAVKYKDSFSNDLNINYYLMKNNNDLMASSLLLAKGNISKEPIINYMLASKAERERND